MTEIKKIKMEAETYKEFDFNTIKMEDRGFYNTCRFEDSKEHTECLVKTLKTIATIKLFEWETDKNKGIKYIPEYCSCGVKFIDWGGVRSREDANTDINGIIHIGKYLVYRNEIYHFNCDCCCCRQACTRYKEKDENAEKCGPHYCKNIDVMNW